MADVLVNEQSLTNIANAIRERNKEVKTYKPAEMDEAIKDLHNVLVKKWIRPSDWPDYSKVDLANQEVIYLTYDCTYDDSWISVRVYGAYTIVRGSLSNGVFTPSSTSTDMASGTVFQESLPTNEGTYVVYKITPQSGEVITRFAFARRDINESTQYVRSWQQPCVERYCRIPNWIGTQNKSNDQYTWTTRYLVADTVTGNPKPLNLANAYSDGYYLLEYVDLSDCSFSELTRIDNCFCNQNNLSEVYLPHDLSNKCTFLNAAFMNCHNLVYIDVSGWDTSSSTLFHQMFNGCRELVEIKGIEDFDFTSATRIETMFSGCKELRLDTSKWETSSSLTNINGLFADCFSLVSLDLSGFNTTNVTNFGSVFSGCNGLEELDISTWKITSSATTLQSMFGYCRKLKKLLRTKDWDVSNVTSFELMFRECRSLEEIDLSDFTPVIVTSVRYMFDGCNSLQSLDLEGWDLTTITSTNNVLNFVNNCWSLEDIKLPLSNYLPGMEYCYKLKNITVPSTITSLGTGDNNLLRSLSRGEYIDFRNLTSVPAISAASVITQEWNNKVRILVPDNLYSSWISTNIWNTSTIVLRTIPDSDWQFYKNGSGATSVDLSNCEWTTNHTYYTSNAAVGTAYASMVNNAASGKRIVSGLVDVPDKALIIGVNDGYQFSVLMYDANGNYLKEYFDWYRGDTIIRWSSIKKIAIVVRIGDGSVKLEPTDWANSGIHVSYNGSN